MFIRQFFAALTILSFTLTQALPAWALRADDRAALRPGIEGKSQSGLEEALTEGAAAASVPSTAVALPFTTVAPAVSREVGSDLLAEVLRTLASVPREGRNTREMTLAALEILRQRAPAEISARIPSAEALAAQLDELIQKGPALGCPTCGAKVAHAVLSDPFTNPQRERPEELQTPEFQAAELLNAVLLALSVAHEGRLLTITGADGHIMPASTAADLRDLLMLSEAHPGFPAEAAHDWVGAQMTQGQMKEALERGQIVVAHVAGNHFVQVTRITGGRVEYTDPQVSAATGEPTPAVASQSEQGFFQWWKGNARPGTAGNVLVGLRPGQELDVRKRLSDAEMAKVVGCCGINATFAHFRSVRKILDAVLRLKYRAPDDTGVLVITREGLVVRKVKGAPDVLILEMIGNALFPEMLDLPDTTQENRDAIASHQARRRALLIEEGLQGSGWVAPEWQDPISQLIDIHESTIEGLYAGTYSIGMGYVGGLYGGWVYTLGDTAGNYQALNGPALQLKDLVSRWDIAPEFVKLFIRHRLMRELPQDEADPTRVTVLADFDRLGDRAVKEALDGDEQQEWDAIWRQYLQGRTITIPPDYNRDAVRHVFHLLDQLVGSFRERPEWEQAVQRSFNERRAAGAREWSWRAYWEKEMRYNMPGHAWAALVDWVQDWTLEEGVVHQRTHEVWMDRRMDQQRRRGFSEGTVDLPLLLVIPGIVLGHGRWAMTGDPSQWNAHPQVTEVRAIVHNGAIEADKNNEFRREHEERYQALMAEAAALRARATDDEQIRQAERMEQAARRNYGRFEDVGETQEIVTDTRTIVRQWHLIADDYKADLAAGRVRTEGEEKGLIDLTQPGRLHRPGQTYEGRPVFDRAQAWNRVVQNLRQYGGKTEPNYDEVAHRVAMLELAPGSLIATDGVSLATPITELITSHDRPVDVVVYQKKDAAGNVLYEDYMVTSDQAAGIGLFPAPEVDRAAREITRLEDVMMRGIDTAREDLASHRIAEDRFKVDVEAALKDYVEGNDRTVKGEKIVEKGPDGEEIVRYRGGFWVKVYHLKGAEKYAKITGRLDDQGRQVVDVRLSKLSGEPLDEGIEAVDETVNPALGDRGRFQSFMEKHIAEIPRILLEQALTYIGVDATGNPVTALDSGLPKGARPVIEQSAEGISTRYHKDTKFARLGINREILMGHFGAGLEEAAVAEPPVGEERFNQVPGLKRIVLVGVGSSWRDAKVAKPIFEDLMSAGVEVLFYDPVEISNRGIKLDPKTDLIIGMSWSGATDSMVRLFNWLLSEGFVIVTITGKPDSDMGRLSRWSGGTINVLSGDEQSVATTKGFESVLYSLSLLAVHLSKLQGDPALEGLRGEYAGDLRKIADLVYGVLSERDKLEGEKVFDLRDPGSTVNRLGRKYRERHKLLWVGSRNMPTHEEGELKGEEIVSSRDKPSMMGIAMDIEDSSWRTVVTHNYDPKADEEDKVVLGLDMTDPDKLDLFMEAIREQAEAGGEMVILTYDAYGNPHREELEHIAAQSGGRVELVTVPQVRPTLQPLLNALFFFRFSLAMAMQRGMTQQEIDNSRNLAKSVTVSYAQRLKDLIASTKSKVVTVVQQALEGVRRAAQWVANHVRAMTITGIWRSITDPRMRAIERLPFVLQRAYDGCFRDGSWLSTQEERRRLQEAFGEEAREIQQIVIVTDEEGTEYAAQASEDPLGSVELIYSGKTATDEGRIYTGTMVPIKGYYYNTRFDQDTNTYTLSYDPEFAQNQGLTPPGTRTLTLTPETAQVAVNGYRYEVDSSSFMKDAKKPKNLAFGLTLRAVNPDLLGVKVKFFRASDRALDREMDRTDTLFVLVSRSNNFHHQNREIPPVGGNVQDERSPGDLEMPGLIRSPETAVTRRAEELQERGGRFVAVSDSQSALRPLGGAALGNVELPSDVDDTSLYSVTYMALLSIGVKLGKLRGIDTDRYREALSTVPGLVARLLRDGEVRKRVDRFARRFGNYKKLQFNGGGQAFADAKECARAGRMLGLFAEAQLNDSMWHGPLAAYDPSRTKFANPDRRVGVNPNFNPRNDTLGVVLMTDRRFFDTALGGDAQVLDSRNARFGLLVKSSDERMDAVQRVGAAEDGIIPLGDFPDELGNFLSAAAGHYFAAVFARAHEQALGRPILAPVGGKRPAPAGAPGAPVVAPGYAPAIESGLRSIGLDPVGRVRDEVDDAIAGLRGTQEPQLRLLPDPWGDPNRAVIVAVDFNRAGLAVDVESPISRIGGDFASTSPVLDFPDVGEVGVGVLYVRNRGPDALRLPFDKIQRTLRGAFIPHSFIVALQPYADQMPGAPHASLRGAYRDVQEGVQNLVTLSDSVPDSATQSALVVMVPDEERFAQLDQQIRAQIQARGLQVLNSFELSYRDNPEHSLVRVLRYLLNAPSPDPRTGETDQRLLDLQDDAERLVNGGAAPEGPAAGTPTPPGAGLEELREGRDYRVDPDGVRMIRSVRINNAVTLSDWLGETVSVGAGTLLLDGLLLRGNITIGENSEIGGIITQYARIGNGVKSHRNSNIKYAEIGDNVHLNGATLRGYSHSPGMRNAEGLVVIYGGKTETRIEDSVLETIEKKEPWSFVNEDGPPDPSAKTLARYGVNQRRTEVGEGAVIKGTPQIRNSGIGAGTKVSAATRIDHSTVGEKAEIRPNANILRSHIGRKANIGSEVSKSYLGDGFVSEHQASYLSLVAPNEYLIVNEAGELEEITSINTTNIGAGTIFANYGGVTDPVTRKSKKGTSIMVSGFTGTNTTVVNLYDHPNVSLADLLAQREVTFLLPFSRIPPQAQVWGLVLPFTEVKELSPKKGHKIGKELTGPAARGRVLTHLRKGLDPRIVEGSIRLGLYLIEKERQRPPADRRWTDEQLAEGERIYRDALASGQWTPDALKAASEGERPPAGAAPAAGVQEPLDALISVLPAIPADAALQNPQAYWLEQMANFGVINPARLGDFLTAQQVPANPLNAEQQSRLLDLLDNYDALHQVFSEAKPRGLGISREQVIDLIQRQAAANGATLAQEVRGVLDVPDSQLPTDAEFDAIVAQAKVLVGSGGNSARFHFETAKIVDAPVVSFAPTYDDGGNWGEWLRAVGIMLAGDTANQRSRNASLLVRQAMLDRTPEKPKEQPEKGQWEATHTVRSLLIQEVANAFMTYFKQYPEGDPTGERTLVRSLATLLSAHRILERSLNVPELLKKKVFSKASGQNLLGAAISIRCGMTDPRTGQVNPEKVKQGVMLWNRALGLGPKDGLVIPGSLEPARLHFVYEDRLGTQPVLSESGQVTGIKLGDAEIAPRDFFTVTLEEGRLVLTDGLNRQLTYDRTAQAYVVRDEQGQIQNRFQPFPRLTGNAIRARLARVPALSIVRGEDHASEEDSWYENTRVLAYGAEFRGRAAAPNPIAREIVQAVLDGRTQVELVSFGPGSEGTSVAPHFFQAEMVDLLRGLEQQRDRGEQTPRAVFLFNPTESNDGYNQGPLGLVGRYEMDLRQTAGDDSIRFQDLIPEVILFDHTDPWVLRYNPAVVEAMNRFKQTPPADVDYLRILGPTESEGQAGAHHSLVVKKNRRGMPQDEPTLAGMRARFGGENVHFGPLGDVRATLESSRGKVTPSARVLAITHRMALPLYPNDRARVLREAVREEQRIYREKHDGQNPTAEELAEFLNKVGANTTAAQVQPLMTGLEELAPAEPVYMVAPDSDKLLETPEAAVPVIAPVPAVAPVVRPAAAPTGTFLDAALSRTEVGEPIQTVTGLLAAFSGLNLVSATTRTEGAAFVVRPDGISSFAVAAHMVGAASAQADILAEDAEHKERVEYLLGELGLAAGVRVHDLGKEYGGDVGRAVAELRSRNEESGLRTEVVTKDTRLEEIARILGVPVEEADLRAGELVAVRTNDIWT